MSWKKLPMVSKLHYGCLNCSTAALEAPMDMEICVGFGEAYVTKDGVQIYDGEQDYRNDKQPKLVKDIEAMAIEDPDHDWRIIKYGPLHGETFQRQDGKWICVESNGGFA